jgi:hypothetical protein
LERLVDQRKKRAAVRHAEDVFQIRPDAHPYQ